MGTSQNSKSRQRSGSFLVAAGILLSRIMGLVRQKVFAHYFGNSDAADAFYAALKIPNFSQNLLGDGVLSASFIPVYSKLVSKGEGGEADRVAGIVGSVLALVNGIIVGLGLLLAPHFIDLIAPGFHGEKRELTIRLVQIFFPSTGLLVMSAWCLGVLNSHRRFFLSYVAPVFWNLAIIAVLVACGERSTQAALATWAAWGVLAGSVIQFFVQFPTVLRCAPALQWGLSMRSPHFREIFRNLVPVVIARGAVQISAYVDNVLASLLPMGAVASLTYAQSLYLLPVSLFGMSVSAAELPAMSSLQGGVEEIADKLQARINAGLKQISFFVIPSVVAFLMLGDAIIGLIYQGGQFTHDNSLYVWGVLAGSTVGLLATTQARLFSSAFYSLKDTRTPLNVAILRVGLTIALGYYCGLRLPLQLGIDRSWGTAGLTASAGFAGWVEYFLLEKRLQKRLQRKIGAPFAVLARCWVAALAAGSAAVAAKLALAGQHRFVIGLASIGLYGILYFAFALALKLEEAQLVVGKIHRRRK